MQNVHSGVTVESLPFEVLEMVMLHLSNNVQDLLACSLVCHSWKHVADQILSSTVVLKISEDVNYKLRTIKDSSRIYKNLYLQDCALELQQDNRQQLLHTLAPRLESLTLDACYVTETEFTELLAACTALQCLILRNLDQTLLSGSLLRKAKDRSRIRKALQHVSSFELRCGRHVTDFLLHSFSQVLPSIAKLALPTANISYQNSVQNRFYPVGRNLAPSEFVTTFQLVLSWISNIALSLRVLDLSETRVDTDAIKKLRAVPGLRITSLNISCCEQVSTSTIEELCASASQHEFPATLTSLDAHCCHRITASSVQRLAKSLPQLRRLNLYGCWAVTADSLSAVIEFCPNMEQLDIGNCDSSSSCAFRRPLYRLAALPAGEAFSMNVRTSGGLTQLGVSALGFDACHLALISLNAPALTHLDLSMCTHAMRNCTLQFLSGVLPHLQSLLLVKCCFLTDAGFMGLCYKNRDWSHWPDSCELCQAALISKRQMASSSLTMAPRRVELCSCRVTCSEHTVCKTFNTYGTWQKLLEAIPRRIVYDQKALNSENAQHDELNNADDYNIAAAEQNNAAFEVDLELNGKCEEKSESFASDLASSLQHLQPASFLNFSSLRKLNLCGCVKLTDHLLSTAFHFNGLVWLNLAQCPHFSSKGLAVMASRCPNIQELFLARCEGVSDIAVEVLVQHLKRLQHLHLQHCALSSTALEVLSNCRTLRALDISGCTQITETAVETFQVHRPFVALTTGNTAFAGSATSPSILSPPPAAPPPPPSSLLHKFRMRLFPHRN